MSRLIDADAITDHEIIGYLGIRYASCLDDVRDLLNEQPIIEAVPVVEGKWIRNENPIETSCECSACHFKDYWYDIDKANEYYWFHRSFCPNCGAKMKGGAE